MLFASRGNLWLISNFICFSFKSQDLPQPQDGELWIRERSLNTWKLYSHGAPKAMTVKSRSSFWDRRSIGASVSCEAKRRLERWLLPTTAPSSHQTSSSSGTRSWNPVPTLQTLITRVPSGLLQPLRQATQGRELTPRCRGFWNPSAGKGQGFA